MKNIVIYFSRADENYGVGYVDKGNTETIAEYIKEKIDSDMFKVERKKEYPKDYKGCCDEALEEQRNGERPELVNYLESIDEYDTVYIGTPIYWGTLPQPMFTELERLKWNGKKIKVFVTHEGSGLGNVVEDLMKVCKGAVIEDSIAVRGRDAKNCQSIIDSWL